MGEILTSRSPQFITWDIQLREPLGDSLDAPSMTGNVGTGLNIP